MRVAHNGALGLLCMLLQGLVLLWGLRFGGFADAASTSLNRPILTDPDITYDNTFTLSYDPPNGYFSPTVIGIFVYSNRPTADIYFAVDNMVLTRASPYRNASSPYIQLNTPFGYGRVRNISIVAVDELPDGSLIRSQSHNLHYIVEGSNRPSSYAFMVPGVESGGYFLGIGIEMNATARAQSSGTNAAIGGQEFADFDSDLGMGTYAGQAFPLNLTAIDPSLTGFEGGFAANTSNGKQYGILVPFFDGKHFVGKVVRVDLFHMIENVTTCSWSWRIETKVDGNSVKKTGTDFTDDVCIVVLDLESIHPNARGFRKGFMNYPYGYLSPGEYNVVVRINVDKFSIASTRVIDLDDYDPRMGGYSGGFADGSWACFCPFRTYAGPVGGIRSKLAVDAGHMRAYYHGIITCINSTAFDHPKNISSVNIKSIDFSDLFSDLRGFSEAIRVGRYAYLSPIQNDAHVYTSKLIRISLGPVDIGTAIASGENLITALDLSAKDPRLVGFSGLYSIGQYLILAPFRNTYEPKNGQRGHGMLTRINMNSFNLDGISFVDMPTVTRAQTPSFNDVDLRGFSGGFANGMYGLLVPFYNGIFHGKIVRFNAIYGPLDINLQELDVTIDRHKPDVYKGYRGGFVSLWRGVWKTD